MTRRALMAIAASILVVSTAGANTYPVTTTADTGAGSLRQAITDANVNVGPDTIAFNIVGSGVHTIAPASPLPAITGPVTIDGYTQPGSSANTNPTGEGLDTLLQIEIDGTGAGSSPCLAVQADDVTIRGLAINRCTNWDIQTSGAHQNFVVEGCFLGTDAAGTQALSPWGGAVYVGGQQNARVGGTTPAARNLISGGSNGAPQIILGDGLGDATGTLVAGNLIGTDLTGLVMLVTNGGFISLQNGTDNVIGGTSAAARNVLTGMIILGTGNFGGTGASGNFVRGNFVGTDVTGTRAFGCPLECIRVLDKDNTIGGAAAGAGNRIGGAGQGNVNAGIVVQAAGTVIQGNFIGTDETGTIRIPNKTYGIRVIGANVTNVAIGGTGPGEGNIIAYNGGSAGIGIEVPGNGTVSGITVRGNSIFDNPGSSNTNGLGIDLVQAGNGVTFNDAGDADAGPNDLQNYPILSSVTYGASTTTIAGTLNSAAATTFDVDFYADPVCTRRPQDMAEGKAYLGSSQVTTNGSGDASFNVVLPVAVPDGSPITVTATDPGGNTSEFSPRFVLSMTPGSGSAAGGVGTVKGLAFEAGVSVTVGGVAATNVVLVDSHTLTIDIHALPAGSINDVFVQNPGGGLSGTLPNGWIADFNDVPSGNQFYSQVTKLVSNAITAGIGGGLYGVNANTLRQQMAVFLLKAKYGACYAPPPCAGVFTDVPCSLGFAPWIEALAAEGITGGCGTGIYCPGNPVRRDQMAVFLLKAEHGSTFVPPACTGVYPDVPCSSPFAPWIEQLAEEGITGGCGSGNYCPLNNVTRGQMAAFLVNTFKLP